MPKPDERPSLPQQRRPVQTIHYVGEPARRCSNCQHWEKRAGTGSGLCHNLIGKAIMTARADDTCAMGFYPDVKRFPLEKRYHVGSMGEIKG